MIILILLIVIFSLGVYVAKKRYEIVGDIICILSGLYIIIHILFWAIASYDYNIFAAKRQAFVETLEWARKNNNELEQAAVIKDISEWNQSLAKEKYNCSVFMIQDYTDKRILTLQPIK